MRQPVPAGREPQTLLLTPRRVIWLVLRRPDKRAEGEEHTGSQRGKYTILRWLRPPNWHRILPSSCVRASLTNWNHN